MKYCYIWILLLCISLSNYSFSQESNTNKLLESNTLFETAIFLLEEKKFYKAEILFQKYLAEIEISENNSLGFKTYQVAKEYRKKALFELAIEYSKKAISIEQKDSALIKRYCVLIVECYLDVENFNLAEKYFKKSQIYNHTIETAQEKQDDLILEGELKRLKGDYDSALIILNKSILLSKKYSNVNYLATCYNNKALLFLSKNNYDSSLFYLNKSNFLIDSLKLTYRKHAIGISYGKLYQAMQQYTKAIDYYQLTFTYDLNYHNNALIIQQEAYEGLSSCYNKIGDYKMAYVALEKSMHLKFLIQDYKRQSISFQKELDVEKKNYEQRIELIEKQRILESKYATIKNIVFGILLLLFFFTIYALYLKIKSSSLKLENKNQKNSLQKLEIEKIKLENNELELILDKNKKAVLIAEMEQQKIEEFLDHKNRELVSSIIHLANKNEVLNFIQTEVKNIRSTHPSIDGLNEITNLIKDNLQLDQDWEMFKTHFESVHPDFFSNLLSRYSNLTNDELKLCAYLKIQLSSKEIARLINITTEAVNKRRNRIRKKFEIEPSVDLVDFLIQFN
jgi:tetratricopeptide (TPR) repeat protein